MATARQAEQSRFMTRVFGWMALGLGITAFVAYVVASQPTLVNLVYSNPWVFWGVVIAQLAEVFIFASLLKRLSPTGALLLFFIYAATVGITFSILLLVYTLSSIGYVFLITSGMFAALSVFGYFTKKDLGPLGTFLFLALIGFIIAQIANLFLHNDQFGLILAYFGVVIFSGLTAFDVQKIKKVNVLGDEGTDEDKKQAINAALELYLDFINLFLNLLRIFGRR